MQIRCNSKTDSACLSICHFNLKNLPSVFNLGIISRNWFTWNTIRKNLGTAWEKLYPAGVHFDGMLNWSRTNMIVMEEASRKKEMSFVSFQQDDCSKWSAWCAGAETQFSRGVDLRNSSHYRIIGIHVYAKFSRAFINGNGERSSCEYVSWWRREYTYEYTLRCLQAYALKLVDQITITGIREYWLRMEGTKVEGNRRKTIVDNYDTIWTRIEQGAKQIHVFG